MCCLRRTLNVFGRHGDADRAGDVMSGCHGNVSDATATMQQVSDTDQGKHDQHYTVSRALGHHWCDHRPRRLRAACIYSLPSRQVTENYSI